MSWSIFIALLATLVASTAAYSLPAASRAASASLRLPRIIACAEPAAVPDSYEAAEARGWSAEVCQGAGVSGAREPV